MKLFFTALFLFSLQLLAFDGVAQVKITSNEANKFTLSGTIKDAATGETLIGANISIKDTNQGIVTNEYGFYSITLPEGTYTFLISYLGYGTEEIRQDLSQNVKLDIEVTSTANTLEEVVITSGDASKSQVRTIQAGVAILQAKDIKKLPAFFGEPDVTRAMLTQPGVSSIGEGTTGFNVRGGNIDQNLILLDEAPIYNNSHIWGFFSVFNADAIKNLKLYKGGIPARFGGRASSVLDIRQKEGNNKAFKGEGGLGLLFSRLTLEGPIKKEKISFLISGRRSYFDLFFPLLDDEIEGDKVFFYDLNTKLTWNINNNNKLFVSGYFGADVMKLSFQEELADNPEETIAQAVDFRWKNATATVRWNHLFSDKLFMNISGIYSEYNYALLSENDSGDGPANTSGTFNWKSAVKNWIFKPDFTYYPAIGTTIRFGVNNTLYEFVPAEVESLEEGINTVNFENERGIEIAPYIEYEKKWTSLSINAGLRYSWFGNLGPLNVYNYSPDVPKTVNTVTSVTEYEKGEMIQHYAGLEPRLSLNYELQENNAIKLGYNRTFQYIHLISNTAAALPFDIWKPAGAHLEPIEVNQLSGGYAFDLQGKNHSYNFSIEGYYKTFKNLVEYKNGADLFLNDQLETQILAADGYAYGAELAAYKNKGKLTGNLNYTYSVTKRKTISPFNSENINGGNYYPSNYDRPHILNLNANYQLTEKWSVGTFFTYQTGRPTTLATGRFRVDGINYFSYSDRNAFRLPAVHRLDVSFTFLPTGNPDTKWESSWNFGVYNFYGRKNAFSTFSTFNENTNALQTFQFSVIGSAIPFVTYNFKF